MQDRGKDEMRKPKVLIVDDEIDMGIFISSLFSSSGYVPVVTRDGEAGLQKARKAAPDIIVMDMMMPEEAGVALYRGLKADASLRRIPVIMLSAVTRKTFDHYLKMLDVQGEASLPVPDAYMEKPPDAKELIALANRLVGQRD
jgi:CheY-like chemotaxis protein